MARQRTEVLSGIIIEEESRLSLRELCDACAVQVEFVNKLVEHGVIEPTGIERSHWCFSGLSLSRVRVARHLQQDLGLNLAGVALALELIDEMQQLRAQMYTQSGAAHE